MSGGAVITALDPRDSSFATAWRLPLLTRPLLARLLLRPPSRWPTAAGRTSVTHNPHDALVKAVFGEPAHAAAYFATVLPAELVARLDLQHGLTLVPGSWTRRRPCRLALRAA